MSKLGHTTIKGHLDAEREVRIGAASGDGITIRVESGGIKIVPRESGVEDNTKEFFYDTVNNRWTVETSLYVEGSAVLTTASEGTGNGLDADTLDGQEGSYYLDLSNATGTLADARLSGSYNLTALTASAGISVGSDLTLARNDGTAPGISISNFDNIRITGGGSTAVLGVSDTNELYIGSSGNKIWHAGNDGASSGLDADVLDGQEGSYYLDLTNATGTLADARLSGSYNITGLTTSGGISVGSDITLTRNDGTAPAISITNFDNIRITDGTYVAALGIDDDDELYIGSSGNKIWHAGNDGASSGLDSDTVDSLEASQFLRSDADDAFTGTLTASEDEGLLFSATGHAGWSVHGVSSGALQITIAGNGGADFELTNGTPADHTQAELSVGGTTLVKESRTVASGNGLSGGGDLSANRTLALDIGGLTDAAVVGGDLVAFGDASDTNAAKKRSLTNIISDLNILTTADEGSGNGLDADTLDGQEGSYYLDLSNLSGDLAMGTNSLTGDYISSNSSLSYLNSTNVVIGGDTHLDVDGTSVDDVTIGNGGTNIGVVLHSTSLGAIGFASATGDTINRIEYDHTSNAYTFKAGGSSIFSVDSGGIEMSVANGPALLTESTSYTNPTIVPNKSDLDTGISRGAENQLSLIAGGVEGLRLYNNSVQALQSMIFNRPNVYMASGRSYAYSTGELASFGIIPTMLNSWSDAWQFATVQDLEYWNGSSWVDWDNDTEAENLFSGHENDGFVVTADKSRWRVTFTSTNYHGGGVAHLYQEFYDSTSATDYTIGFEKSSDGVTWGAQTTFDTSVGAGNSSAAYLGYFPINLSDADTWYRVEIDNSDDTNDRQYRMLRMLTNRMGYGSYLGLPFEWDKDANITMQGDLVLPSGSISEPAIRFSNDTDTGIYLSSIGQMSHVIGGSEVMRVNSQVLVNWGSASTPSIGLLYDPDTGIHGSAGDLRITTAGTTRTITDSTGIRIALSDGPRLAAESPSATNPVILPNTADADTGIGQNAVDQLSFIAGGTEVVRVTSSGMTVNGSDVATIDDVIALAIALS
jgi:hypothetical protein